MVLTLVASLAFGQAQFERVPLQGNPVFDDLAKTWIEMTSRYMICGFGVVAIKDGNVVLLDAYGYSDPLTERKADIDTRYYVASITKTMTAMAIMQLAEQGKIELDAPVQRYLPRFDLADKQYAKGVTIRDLLSHRKGIRGGFTSFIEASSGGVTEDRFYTMLAGSKATGKPAYSNTHFTLLGRVIQAATGKRWQNYEAANIFAPLGMTRTVSSISELKGDLNVAIPFSVGQGGAVPSQFLKSDRTMHAAGGTVTTSRDMARYLSAWLNDGELAGKRVLRPSSVADAFRTHSQVEPNGTLRRLEGYGLPWSLGTYRGKDAFASHGGGYAGYQTYIAMVPSKKIAVAVLLNTDGPGQLFASVLAVDMLDRLLGYPVDEETRKANDENLKNGVERLKKAKPIGPNPAVSGLLSLPVASYAGRYENKGFGTIHLGVCGGYLTFQIDDLPQQLKSTKMDECTIHDDIMDAGSPIRFVVRSGKCVAVELQNGKEWIPFARR